MLNAIKGRLTSVTRFPYNFIKGPFIGWDAPKAFISDMGGFTLPQVAIAAILGGSGETNVLGGNKAAVSSGPGGSLQIPESECVDAVKKLTGVGPAARRAVLALERLVGARARLGLVSPFEDFFSLEELESELELPDRSMTSRRPCPPPPSPSSRSRSCRSPSP